MPLLQKPSSFLGAWANWYLILFFIPIVFNPFGYLPFEIPKVVFLFAVVSLFCLIGVLQLWKGKGIRLYWNPYVLGVLGLWLLSLTISTFIAVAPIESFWGTYERLEGWLSWVYYLLHFGFCLQIFVNEDVRQRFLDITFWLGVVLSVYGIFQFFGLHLFFTAGDYNIFAGRSYATVGQPTMFGQWLIFPFFVALFQLFQKKKQRFRLMNIVGFVMIVVGLLTTINRASFLALAVSLLLLGFMKMWKRNRVAMLGSLGVLILLFLLFVMFGGSMRSVFSRFTLWQDSLGLFSLSPLFGNGLESFYQLFQTVVTPELFLTEGLYVIPDRAHNVLIHVFVEQGLLGLGVFVTPFIMTFLWLFRGKLRERSLMAGLALIATFVTVQFSFFFSAQYVFFFAFLALLLHEVGVLKEFRFRSHVMVKVLSLASALAFVLFSWSHASQLLVADMKVYEGMNAQDEVDSFEAFVVAESLVPTAAFPHKMLIHRFGDPVLIANEPIISDALYQADGLLQFIAADSFESSIASARFAFVRGDFEEAQAQIEQAKRKAPNAALVWHTAGDIALNNGSYAEAIASYEKLLLLAPSYWDEDDDRARIFRKSTPLFFVALEQLVFAYEANGNDEAAENLRNRI